MLGKFTSIKWSDADGNPTGGCTFGTGFTISWQNGPLGRNGERKEPNGAFVETIIKAAHDRLAFYQSSKFNCEENAKAMAYLDQALSVLNSRTNRREHQKVEGTHEGK